MIVNAVASSLQRNISSGGTKSPSALVGKGGSASWQTGDDSLSIDESTSKLVVVGKIPLKIYSLPSVRSAQLLNTHPLAVAAQWKSQEGLMHQNEM